MKKLFYLFGVLTLIVGCNQKYNKSELVGTWDIVSNMDIESGNVELPETDVSEFIEIKSDSLYLGSDATFAWHVEGDSIILSEQSSVYIKKLTSDTLIVEYDFLGKNRLTLKKRSN